MRRADLHWTTPKPGERRRRYVVTALRQDNETTEQTDQRIATALGLNPDNNNTTCSVYDPTTNDFHDLTPKNLHWCQKQPSTKTATRGPGNAMSTVRRTPARGARFTR